MRSEKSNLFNSVSITEHPNLCRQMMSVSDEQVFEVLHLPITESHPCQQPAVLITLLLMGGFDDQYRGRMMGWDDRCRGRMTGWDNQCRGRMMGLGEQCRGE